MPGCQSPTVRIASWEASCQKFKVLSTSVGLEATRRTCFCGVHQIQGKATGLGVMDRQLRHVVAVVGGCCSWLVTVLLNSWSRSGRLLGVRRTTCQRSTASSKSAWPKRQLRTKCLCRNGGSSATIMQPSAGGFDTKEAFHATCGAAWDQGRHKPSTTKHSTLGTKQKEDGCIEPSAYREWRACRQRPKRLPTFERS